MANQKTPVLATEVNSSNTFAGSIPAFSNASPFLKRARIDQPVNDQVCTLIWTIQIDEHYVLPNVCRNLAPCLPV